jgi:hypothetical protein
MRMTRCRSRRSTAEEDGLRKARKDTKFRFAEALEIGEAVGSRIASAFRVLSCSFVFFVGPLPFFVSFVPFVDHLPGPHFRKPCLIFLTHRSARRSRR